jgi:hypothetical protein
MGWALQEGLTCEFGKLDAPWDQREALQRHRRELRRIRLELAELKRIGSQEHLAELIPIHLHFRCR